MITLRKGQTNNMYFTARESATISAPRFLFIFEHRATKAQIVINLANSSASIRFDLCSIVVNTYFANADTGLYKYTIRQKSDSSTTINGAILEEGYMELLPATDFAPDIYANQSNTFVIHGE